MTRIPLLSGSSVQAISLADDLELVVAPPPLDPIGDVGAAVRDALRFPLEGPPLDDAARSLQRATIVVEPPVLPLPGVEDDPRRAALAAVVDGLGRIGIPSQRQTILVAGGLERRAGRAELEALLRPDRARDFRGAVVVHDAASDALLPLGDTSLGEARVAPALVETDLVIVVSAAETALHGGPATLLGACGAELVRASSGGESLLEPSRSPGWRAGREVAELLGSRLPVYGVSLVLDHPRPTGRLRGWPHDAATRDRIARSHLRRLHNALPTGIRRRLLQRLAREVSAVGVLAGPPATAHVEALLRAVGIRAVVAPEPFSALVVPIPWKSATVPRDAVHPLAATAIGLGLAARLWRNAPPLAPGGALILAHSFRTAFARPSTRPSRIVYDALRAGGPDAVRAAEPAAAIDPVALDEYRARRAPHPLKPFADWDACAAVRHLAGRVIVGGCRDAVAARTLGFVPSHNLETALQMARGVAGGRIGVLVGPPYPPLVVGEG